MMIGLIFPLLCHSFFSVTLATNQVALIKDDLPSFWIRISILDSIDIELYAGIFYNQHGTYQVLGIYFADPRRSWI